MVVNWGRRNLSCVALRRPQSKTDAEPVLDSQHVHSLKFNHGLQHHDSRAFLDAFPLLPDGLGVVRHYFTVARLWTNRRGRIGFRLFGRTAPFQNSARFPNSAATSRKLARSATSLAQDHVRIKSCPSLRLSRSYPVLQRTPMISLATAPQFNRHNAVRSGECSLFTSRARLFGKMPGQWLMSRPKCLQRGLIPDFLSADWISDSYPSLLPQ